jgi:magnesium transporter
VSLNPNVDSEIADFVRRRRMTRTSINDSDVDSHASRDSQETEEDVCFPMMPEHVKVNGIDFDEIEEFIQESRQEDIKIKKEHDFLNNSSSELSSAALKYIPKFESGDEAPGVSFGVNKVEGQDIAPDRFSFFCSESEETVHAPNIEALVKPGGSIQELFRNGEPTWWLDCSCPTDSEMKVLAKAFGMHPLTAEDIRMQETREKVELFKSYYFVCFHTFESDHESEDFLEPINIYIVVFKHGVLTFHFNPISHAINVRRRVRQLRDYVDVSADWLCYALIDDITDSFAPVIHAIEYEADAIEDQVFLTREMDLSHMLQKIGESRRKVMTLMRLLSGKADVIKMFAKRCQDEVQGIGPNLTSVNLSNLSTQHSHTTPAQPQHGTTNGSHQAQPRGDIALYLGDIQDHVVTMYQNLLSYEKIFSRSHSNYLAQLQVESFYSNNKVTEMLSKVTMIGTILVPLNLITGMFGMNVPVPGQETTGLGAFFGIFGFIIFLVIVFSFSANWWLTRNARIAQEESVFAERRSVLNWGRRRERQNENRSRDIRSVLSFPSHINRYD